MLRRIVARQHRGIVTVPPFAVLIEVQRLINLLSHSRSGRRNFFLTFRSPR